MTSDVGLWRALADEWRRGILDGTHPVGSKLPSIREARKQFEVAAGTVQTALDQLVAEGLVEKRPGSGHYVLRSTPLPGIEQRLTALEQRVERLEQGRDEG